MAKFLKKPMTWVRATYDWVLGWAEHRHSEKALFSLALAEASFFPIPPDVLLLAMGVGVPRRAFRFAFICLAGSVLGGILGYMIGFGVWQSVDQFFFDYIPNFTPELFQKVALLYQENAFFAVFTAGFTPIPYKIFTITAGVAQVSVFDFIAASVLGRGMRFFAVAGALWYFGPSTKIFIDRHFDRLTIFFTVLLIGGFLALKYLF